MSLPTILLGFGVFWALRRKTIDHRTGWHTGDGGYFAREGITDRRGRGIPDITRYEGGEAFHRENVDVMNRRGLQWHKGGV